jgi:pyochelin biosynthetic protein PchC
MSIDLGGAGLWIRCFRPRSTASLRLLCFPHAGGSANFYRSWVDRLPEHIELWAVQYPGREDRFGELCISDMDRMVTAFFGAVEPKITGPVALFGHSMGASIAYEFARRLEAHRPGLVLKLFVSGSEAPSHRAMPDDPKHLWDEAGLVTEVEELGGTPGGVLDHPEMRELLLPMIRSDYQLIESYQPSPGSPVCFGVVALTGDADPGLSVEQVQDWREITRGEFTLKIFDGDHFYLVPHRDAVIDAVVAGIAEVTDIDGR